MCGYPPSFARSQNAGTGISGIILMMKAASAAFFSRNKRLYFMGLNFIMGIIIYPEFAIYTGTPGRT